MDGDWAKLMKQCEENRRMNFYEDSLAPFHWAVYLTIGFVLITLLLTGALG
jgi:hypothetical protein